MESKHTGKTRISLRTALLLGSLIGFLVVGGWLLNVWQRPAAPTVAEPQEASESPQREITLYFSMPDGSGLLSETGFIDACGDEEECLRSVVNALIAGPRENSVTVLPDESRLLSLELRDSLVVLNFDKSFVSGHPGGTQSELLTVYALANTLAVNFPHVRQVTFQVAGQPLETIKGHVDLRQPVVPDFSLVEEAEIAGASVPDIPVRSE